MEPGMNNLLDDFRSEFLGKGRSNAAAMPKQQVRQASMDITKMDDYQRIQEMKSFFSQEDRRNPYFMARDSTIGDTVSIEDRKYISYSGYNYLGLSDDARVIAAVQKSVARYGTHAGAARMVGGEMRIHSEMEGAFADAFGFEDCVSSVGGYVVNVMTIGYLLGPKDLIIMDEQMHNSGVMGGVMSHARRILFPHNDYYQLSRLLEENRSKYERAMVLVEGAYSMDGDVADLPRLLDLKHKYNAWLMIDEAHSFGVVGATGRGVCEYWGVNPHEVDLLMGTLSKSFASCGGFLGGSKDMIDTLRHFAPGLLLYSTGLPPAAAAASLEAVTIMVKEPERVQRLQHNIQCFVELAKQRGLDAGPSGASAVVPIMLGDTMLALSLMSQLLEAGVIAHAVMYPVVPRDKARLRFFISSQHTEEQFIYTLDLLQRILRKNSTF
jgi:8-amino-7-oxononanoate synthase